MKSRDKIQIEPVDEAPNEPSSNKIKNKDLFELQGQHKQEKIAEFQSIVNNYEKQHGPLGKTTDKAWQHFLSLKKSQEYQKEGSMTEDDRRADKIALVHHIEDDLGEMGGWKELKRDDDNITLNAETNDSIEVQARFIYNQRDTDEKRIEYAEKLLESDERKLEAVINTIKQMEITNTINNHNIEPEVGALMKKTILEKYSDQLDKQEIEPKVFTASLNEVASLVANKYNDKDIETKKDEIENFINMQIEDVLNNNQVRLDKAA